MSTFPSDPPSVAGDYFDGQSARVHRVTLTLSGDRLLVNGDTIRRDEPLAALRLSEPMGAAPRLIAFADGAHCEVRDHAALRVLLEKSGHVDSWVVRMHQYWRAALASIAITVAALAAGYFWGLPALSEWIAFHIPEKLLTQMGGGSLAFLDRAALEPTKLPAARQQALRSRFDRLVTPDHFKARHEIVFRQGNRVGANALTLPDGTIVVTDELVALAASDEEVMAVLSHELGHLNRRHSLRMLIQSSIVAFMVTWYLGDVSNVAAGIPTFILQARYSRDHERDADQFAAAMLKANGLSPRLLAEMLEKLEAAHLARRKSGEPSPGDPRGDARESDYYSTHPATRERIEALTR